MGSNALKTISQTKMTAKLTKLPVLEQIDLY
jgi:hypothetical protein